jgi:hypothetical protein
MNRLVCALVCPLVLLLACGPGTVNSDCDDVDSPPAAGGACAEDGVICDGGADVCIDHVVLECKAGSWQEQSVPAIECGTSTPTTGTDESSAGTTAITGTTDTTGAEPVPCGAALPPEGSACAVEGEDCAPGASECDPFVGARCMGGAWQHYEVGPGDPEVCGGPVACDPQNIPPEGAKCEVEGEFCSPGCEDPCEFCNVVRCEGGLWQGLEVFPANCLDCETLCTFVVPSGCMKGPLTQADCVTGCQDLEAGECRIPFHLTLACADVEPTFGCDAMGRPVAAGCEQQFDALYMCTGL